MKLCDSATEGFGDQMKVVRYWRWIIKDNEIQWLRSRGKVWRMTFSVDPKKSPNEIDLTYLDGPVKGKKSLGMYRWGGIRGNTLELTWSVPPINPDARLPVTGFLIYRSQLPLLEQACPNCPHLFKLIGDLPVIECYAFLKQAVQVGLFRFRTCIML